MQVIRCDNRECANLGKETCRADRVVIVDSECKSAITYEQLMRQKPEGKADKC